MGESQTISSSTLADLPADELAAYGRELGLVVDAGTPRGELLRRIRDRRLLLVELDRDALLDIVMWARVPVRRSAGKELLAKQIAAIRKSRFEGITERGLRALARLRGLDIGDSDSRTTIERQLKSQAGWWARLRRRRRSLVGTFISDLVEHAHTDGDYRFLPEQDEQRTLKESIEDVGVVEGIAQRIRGAADRYVYEKLDEIEARIDRKLDQIDQRLAEWRDQEVTNRLRLVKITLITTIVVAVISLGYNYMKSGGGPEMDGAEPAGELATNVSE